MTDTPDTCPHFRDTIVVNIKAIHAKTVNRRCLDCGADLPENEMTKTFNTYGETLIRLGVVAA